MRFQELMPDVLHWLGVRRIHRLVSMSNLKYDAIVGSGIEVVERIQIPDDLIPADARVEMEAKKAAGYFTDERPGTADLATTKGRALSALDAAASGRTFQVDPAKPLVGLEGRAALLRRLGAALIAREEVFDELARPGGLFETLIPDDENALAAPDLLYALQDGLSSI